MLLAGQFRARIQTWREDLSFLHNIQTSSGDHPAYSMGTVVLSQGYSSWSMMLTTQLHLTPRLIKSGAIPLLPLYVFMVWTGTTSL